MDDHREDDLRSVTTRDLDILLHTLGLDVDHREPWRNHFVADKGHSDLPAIGRLQAAGLMALSRRPDFLDDADLVFHVTDAGRLAAMAENGRRHPPRTARQARYQRWLTLSDVCPDLTFGAFLRGHLY